MSFVTGTYTEADADDVASLFSYLSGDESTTRSYSGQIELSNGVPQNNEAFTLIAARSLAENSLYSRDGELISGTLNVVDGQLEDLSVVVTGDSLLHSVPLTTQAFTRGLFGQYGQYIVSIGLMLFAFSTAIAWSYYGIAP